MDKSKLIKNLRGEMTLLVNDLRMSTKERNWESSIEAQSKLDMTEYIIETYLEKE
jgi:hypothetical protein